MQYMAQGTMMDHWVEVSELNLVLVSFEAPVSVNRAGDDEKP